VDFDQHEARRSMAGQFDLVTPLFMTPSVFISKIRPFLPIQTDNYSKAFVKALICATSDTGDSHRSELLQRSFSYFVKQGIDDEAAIGNIIKRELFLKEFEEKETKGQAEEFILSEVNAELERARAAAQELESILAEMKTKVEEEKNQSQKVEQKYQFEVEEKDKKIEEKNEAIITLEEKVTNINQLLINQQATHEQSELRSKYYRDLMVYQEKRWKEYEKNYQNGKKILTKFILIHLIPVAAAFFITQGDRLGDWLDEHNFPREALYILALVVSLVIGVVLNVYRTLFIDKPEKELVRRTWEYLWGDRELIREDKMQEYKQQFDKENPQLANSIQSDLTSIPID
ncbi:MAG: hypothetical protein KKG00_10745, partial [Bacteroidetes bacterium]|nr:hypothetical protein [Bacteroidota bacterium]